MGAVRINPEYQALGDYAKASVNNRSISDLNSVTAPGIYAFYQAITSNKPASSPDFWTLLVMTYGADFYRVFQVAFGCGDNSNNVVVYVRHSYHSSGSRLWSGWTKLH